MTDLPERAASGDRDTAAPGRNSAGQDIAAGLPPIHPGEVLQARFLHPMGLSVEKVATAIAVPAETLQDVVDGNRPLNAGIGALLARYLGTEEHFWNRLQQEFEQEASASTWQVQALQTR
jgi:addiction module HigA family antidote